MVVSITQFREDLFSLVESAAKGEVVEFTHKGIRFRVSPEVPLDKLSRIAPLDVVNSDTDLDAASQKIFAEIQREWDEDWSEIT
jgi:antitoxin (DNA-binding transcriptional repressor) of toxin-antitoxin stability system